MKHRVNIISAVNARAVSKAGDRYTVAGVVGAADGGGQGGGEDCGVRLAQAGQAGAIGEADGRGDVDGDEAVVGHPGASLSDRASGDGDGQTANTQGGAGC